MPTDRLALWGAAFLRAVATGMAGVLLGLYLVGLGLSPLSIGLVVAAGLWGAALASLVVTLRADALGRRRFLIGLTLLGGLGGAALALSSTPAPLVVCAFAGMINGMGRDRGAALVLEQAALPGTTSEVHRTRAFAVYAVLQDVGHAIGSLLAALPALLERYGGVGERAALRSGLGLYVLLLLACLPFYARLSPAVEQPAREAPIRLDPASRRILVRLSALFGIDSVAGGFLTASLLAVFFHERFGVGAAALGPLFFGARVANAASHLVAAWLARRIGLVNTMVFTHVPSSLLLVTVAFAPTFPIAAALFLLREGLVEMDVPTRQSYVMAVVRPEERTIASGVTHLVRMAGWAVAPAVAGAFMQGVSLLTPLLIGAGLKVTYDVLLFVAFRRVAPPEERAPEDRA